MIRLLVEDYCHKGCKAFEADVDEPVSYYKSENDPMPIETNTVIRCTNRNLCKQLIRYLKKANEEAKA